jgi:SpoVK/Ycf46/Vps4 family AAA+-type ATPase
VYNEREWYISERVLTPSYLERVSIDFGDNVPDTRQISWLAGATGGLTIRAIEDMRLTGERHGNLSRDMVQRIINETISETFAGQGGSEYLTVINPTKGLRDYGFPPYLVEYLEWFLGEFREGRRRNANILKAGPPGTGKSVLAYAIAYELGYKCVHWSPALTQSKWVGESEQQLQKVLNWVEANLPCMLFVDEIDVALTSRDGGSVDTSGVGSKMLSILMPWLERDDIKGRLLFVGATNRPDNIDSAMKRRLQTIIPVLPPMMPEDRFQVVMNILQREQGLRPEECEVPDEVIGDATRWYTQANLSILVEKAVSLARRQKREFTSDVAGFLRRATELYRVDTARTETLSYLAAAQCTDDDMLPPGFARKQDREVKKLLREIEDDEMGPSERGVR